MVGTADDDSAGGSGTATTSSAATPEGPSGETGSDGARASMQGIERAFLRLTMWQTVLSLAGVFIGAVALYAALNESQAVRQQTAATVWPFLLLSIADHVDDDGAHFALQLENVGVGPARVRSSRLTLDDAPHTQWSSFLEALTGTPAESLTYGKDFVNRRVIAPGEKLYLLSTQDHDLVVALQQAIASGSADLAYCYCSIFDQCWLQLTGEVGEPRSVEVCPDYGDATFLD